MAKPERRGGLGRGLGSLLPGSYDPVTPAAPGPDRQRVTIAVEEEAALEAPVSTRPAYTPSEETVTDEVLSEPIPREVSAPAPLAEPSAVKVADEVPLEMISPNPDQPRTQFKKEEIDELAASIEKDGLLQPILVRQMEDGSYQIIAGERRWQASRAAGLSTVPIRVTEADDDQALELALIENIQRSDLNPIEEAYGYRRLMERRSMTQAEVAQAVSKGRSTVANALRLLDLPEEAQQLLFEEKITAGHARAILSVPTQEGRATLTNKIVEGNMTVREAENLARLLSGKKESASAPRPAMPAVYKSVAKTLRETLHTNVRVKSSKGKNKIEIEFKDEEDLQRLFNEIVNGEDE
ncbi:ParB/RepB/Spo0J family partition protein [Adlercreutzia sp. R7]|uniref:ParB/RepB/Spo0J family partition protein n=1 Tax=Adlercreutzia wanghongyangiae TaxID=3111451 RepID=A0ABU6IFG0_9ACTN|nr:ParB/RepB/Spo0J family partition protein [Adlercreutzia sp. R7]